VYSNMLRRLSSSIPHQVKPIVRRYSDKPFYENEGYVAGAVLAAASGYSYSFLYGMDQSHQKDALSQLVSGAAYSALFGTLVGLPVAATWPLSIPALVILGSKPE
jgi:hypothetical protein